MSLPEPPPPQTHAIELYFDPALENQVLKAWNVLARRQITTHLISISARPHITLLRLSLPDPLRLQPSLRSLSAVPISLSAVGSSSSSSSSLSLLPTPTAALLHLHAQVHDLARREGGGDVGEEYRVDGWTPCCAVAEEVPRGRIGEAFCVVRDLRMPVAGYGVEIGVVEVGTAGGDGAPLREVFSCVLGAGTGLPDV